MPDNKAGAKTAKAALHAAKSARRASLNHKALEAYGYSLVALLGIFILCHLVRRAARSSKKPTALVALPRLVRKVAIRKAPTTPSVGHLTLTWVYVALNIAFTFSFLDNKNMPLASNIASRTGWMAEANMFVVIVLALKNTPLAPLTGWSYERLNILHRVAGYVAIFFAVVHGCTYAGYDGIQAGKIAGLRKLNNVEGMIAGGAFVVLGVAGVLVRHRWYELFYYVHVVFWVLSAVMIGLHQPKPAKKVVIVTAAAAGLWGLDRLVRLVRLAWHGANNSVTLTPLSHGGTRVELAKAPLGVNAGHHGFLWIPAIRAAETHPFTVSARTTRTGSGAGRGLEFVVSAHDGFTYDLHQRALREPGVTLRASVEGPYGTTPNPASSAYDKVVLVAGGSGSTFTIGMALRVLEKLREGDAKEVVFVWMVRHRPYISWFAEHLKTLQADTRFSLNVYITRAAEAEDVPGTDNLPSEHSDPNFSGSSSEKHPAGNSDKIHEAAVASTQPTTAVNTPRDSSDKKEEGAPAVGVSYSASTSGSDSEDADDTTALGRVAIRHERPDVPALLRAALGSLPSDKRALVMCCGPQMLTTEVRDTTAELIRTDGPSIELHCEQFGW